MSAPRALVANAADKQQVEEAGKKEKRGRLHDNDDLNSLLDQPAFLRVAWRLLDEASTLSSIIGSTPEMTYYNAGKQDYGHWLIKEFETARPGAYMDIIAAHKKETGL